MDIYEGPDHPQIKTMTPWGEMVMVDEGILDVLLILWEQGVRTEYSCQGDPGHFAYVAYARRDHRAVQEVIHSMALPYVCWCRHPSDEIWSVHWYWDWTVIAQVESVLRLDESRSQRGPEMG